MKKVFIIHGFNGEPNGSWKSWLMWELGKKKIYACALPMPTPDKPKKDEWIKKITEEIGNPNEEIFLVGHSLGVPAILRYLETLPEGIKISGAVLVAGPIHVLSSERHKIIGHFMDTPFDFKHIKSVCKNFVVIHGDDDTTVLFKHAIELSKNLSCELIPVPGGKHLSRSSGWYELPEALESLEKMM